MAASNANSLGLVFIGILAFVIGKGITSQDPTPSDPSRPPTDQGPWGPPMPPVGPPALPPPDLGPPMAPPIDPGTLPGPMPTNPGVVEAPGQTDNDMIEFKTSSWNDPFDGSILIDEKIEVIGIYDDPFDNMGRTP